MVHGAGLETRSTGGLEPGVTVGWVRRRSELFVGLRVRKAEGSEWGRGGIARPNLCFWLGADRVWLWDVGVVRVKEVLVKISLPWGTEGQLLCTGEAGALFDDRLG